MKSIFIQGGYCRYPRPPPTMCLCNHTMYLKEPTYDIKTRNRFGREVAMQISIQSSTWHSNNLLYQHLHDIAEYLQTAVTQPITIMMGFGSAGASTLGGRWKGTG